MYYRINWKPATKQILLGRGQGSAPAVQAGYTSLGTFRHDNDAEVATGIAGHQQLADNHTLYHHVQEALYKVGVQDMQSVEIRVA